MASIGDEDDIMTEEKVGITTEELRTSIDLEPFNKAMEAAGVVAKGTSKETYLTCLLMGAQLLKEMGHVTSSNLLVSQYKQISGIGT